MRKILSIVFILCFSIAIAQKTEKTPFSSKVSISQKYGETISDGEYVLDVMYDDKELKFKTSEGFTYSVLTSKKVTDKYVIGEKSGNYCFYNIEEKQLYFMDYFMSRYLVNGYGKDYSKVKETTNNVMDMLKGGKTQKDVIQHLVDQSSYDF